MILVITALMLLASITPALRIPSQCHMQAQSCMDACDRNVRPDDPSRGRACLSQCYTAELSCSAQRDG
jgi:hypothetical protein